LAPSRISEGGIGCESDPAVLKVEPMKKAIGGEYSEKEAERRAAEAIRRSFAMPYKPHKELVGKTPRARAAARRKAKGSPKSK
jgi:hypothetical protein